MKSLFSLSVVCILTAGSAAWAVEAGALDPAGTWLTEDGKAKIRIEKCGADHTHLCGSVAWLKEPLDENGRPKTDVKNPDPAKRNRPALGMPLFSDLTPDEDGVYAGKIYNAENGKLYDVTYRVDKPAESHVKGCVLSILCGSQNWTRVPDMPASVVANTQTKVKVKAAAPAE